ncbi:hypothetical protein DSECCO2_614210 [anaerobic digester metagenome]
MELNTKMVYVNSSPLSTGSLESIFDILINGYFGDPTISVSAKPTSVVPGQWVEVTVISWQLK